MLPVKLTAWAKLETYSRCRRFPSLTHCSDWPAALTPRPMRSVGFDLTLEPTEQNRLWHGRTAYIYSADRPSTRFKCWLDRTLKFTDRCHFSLSLSLSRRIPRPRHSTRMIRAPWFLPVVILVPESNWFGGRDLLFCKCKEKKGWEVDQ